MPPKTRFEKTCYFYRIRGRFFIVFRLADIEILCAQPMFCKDFRCFTFSDWDRFCIRKTSQKPLRNHPETMIKSNLQTCCFSTSIFSGFWEGLGTSWVPLGLHWAPVRHLLGVPCVRLGRSWAFLGCSWARLGRISAFMDAFGFDFDVSGLDLGALGARFWSPRGSILDPSMLRRHHLKSTYVLPE